MAISLVNGLVEVDSNYISTGKKIQRVKKIRRRLIDSKRCYTRANRFICHQLVDKVTIGKGGGRPHGAVVKNPQANWFLRRAIYTFNILSRMNKIKKRLTSLHRPRIFSFRKMQYRRKEKIAYLLIFFLESTIVVIMSANYYAMLSLTLNE